MGGVRRVALRRSGGWASASVVVVSLLLAVGLSLAPVAAAARPVEDPSGPQVKLTAPAVAGAESFKVSWAATPALPGGGWDAYRVEYREPGGEIWLAWQTAVTAGSAIFAGEPGHCYEFRAAAAKTGDPATVGPWSPVKAVAVPADDAAFKVTKKWTNAEATGAYLGKVRSSTVKGATAVYTFRGAKTALMAPRGPALGKVAVHVRSAKAAGGWTAFKKVKTIDLYAKKAEAKVLTAIGSYKPDLDRQVKLVVTGTRHKKSRSTKVSFDGLVVYGASLATGKYELKLGPQPLEVVITESLQLTATIPGCPDQRVTWEVARSNRFGERFTDESAGTISANGLYRAPALPTVKSSTVDPDSIRSYYVTVRAVANPDELYILKEITVLPWPSPTIDSEASPSSGAAGSTVTLKGDHFTHPDPDVELQVFISSLQLEVVHCEKTAVTVRLPASFSSYWKPTFTANMYALTAAPSPTSWHQFTVTGVKPSPPNPGSINKPATTADDNASVGDELRIYGYGFCPDAAQNVVRFGGGQQASASDYQAGTPGTDAGTIFVTVPEGAQSGVLSCRRTDGDGEWSTGGPNLEVKPATVITAGLHPSFDGRYTGPRLVSNGRWSPIGEEEEWALQGANFTKLRIASYDESMQGGAREVFWLDIRRGGHTYSRIMRAVSDTVAVPHRNWGEQSMFPEEVFGDVPAGAVVQIRVRGEELTNGYERTSEWTSVTIGERPYYGSMYELPAANMLAWWGTSKTIAKGSWLRITHGQGQTTQMLTAPGLWSGVLPVGADGVAVRLVPLTTTGSYTITNQTSGESTQLVVADVGPPDGGRGYGSETQTDLLAEGVKMRVDGAEVDVPPGAFWAGDLTPVRQYFSIRLDHFPDTVQPWDSTLTNGGHLFSLSVTPEVTRLLKPITVTVPYEVAGRATVPFLGMWDPDSKLYYDFGVREAQIDRVNHRITYVIPNGNYVSQAGGGSSARAAAAPAAGEPGLRAAPSDAVGAASPPGPPQGRPFNHSFLQVGAVSSTVSTGGDTYTWVSPRSPVGDDWGVRVDVVTDPASSSYVPPAKAQEVLDVAVDTWQNLVGQGWREPQSIISITVRDFGPPQDYQGATTKAVFGQPWMYVNSRLATGTELDTAVSHEMGHVFQRQYTTNVATYWIDEAVAEWVAWDTLGPNSDLKKSFEAGCDFPRQRFPVSLRSGYNTEQSYAAGAFIIWLADTYGAEAVRKIYEYMDSSWWGWDDAPAALLHATGQTVPSLLAGDESQPGFARAYWMQMYDPLKQYTWSSRDIARIGASYTAQLTLNMPIDSSLGPVFAPSSEFQGTLSGEPMVARAPALPAGALIHVYRDTTAAAAPPGAPAYLGTLSAETPVVNLGAYQGGCYRLVAITPPGGGLPGAVHVEAVRLKSLSPTSASGRGGTVVTLTGCGFGDAQGSGRVTLGGIEAAVGNWSNTQISITVPNMGTFTGPTPVRVYPDVGGPSNDLNITLTN